MISVSAFSGEAAVLVTLERPEKRNAFDDALIEGLTGVIEDLAGRDEVRCVVITGRGAAFSAGADIGWMRRMADADEAANLEDARALARLMRVLDHCPKPTVAMVNGAAIGGGVGLVAACDVAIASDAAVFALAEVRLGIIPAVIGPYVAAAIGPRQARRYMLSAERIGAAEAKRIGLVHDVVPATYLRSAAETVVGRLLEGGPGAQSAAKAFLRELAVMTPGEARCEAAARAIGRLRATDEAREGLSAFLDKRTPAWRA